MSVKYKSNLYEFFDFYNSHTLYAKYHTADINAPKIDVEILDKVTTFRNVEHFWIVKNCDTEKVFLATSSQLEDIYYYGD